MLWNNKKNTNETNAAYIKWASERYEKERDEHMNDVKRYNISFKIDGE